MKTTRKKLRFSVIFISLFITLVFLFYFYTGSHFMNNNRFENARRLVCKDNLKKIQQALTEQNIRLDKQHYEKIDGILKEYNLFCPSGLKIHDNKIEAQYYIFTNVKGDIMIREKQGNHNCENFVFTDLPYENYFLYQNKDGEITIGIDTESLSQMSKPK